MYQSYVYKITNRITGQFYYGSRCSNVRLQRHPKDDLWVHYFTSSKRVKELINEHGVDSFDTEIVETHDTYDKSFWKEQTLIMESRGDQLCLNKAWTDPSTGKTVLTTWNETEEEKIQRSLSIKIGKKGKSNGREGSKHSPETKAKIADQKGWKHSDESKQKMRKPKGPMSDERKEVYKKTTTASWDKRREKFGPTGRRS